MAEAGRMGIEIPPSVIKTTRAVLLSGLKGVPLVRFCRDYKALVGEEFPWKKLGFKSLVEMLNAMPDVVRFEFSEKDGGYWLYPVADPKSFMPSWFKKAQGRPTAVAAPVFSDVVASLDEAEPSKTADGLTYNSYGLVTVYVSWTDNKTTPMDATAVLEKKELLTSLMTKVGKPIKVFVHPKRYGFVRFKTLTEARSAIKTFHQTSVGGQQLTVRPANEQSPEKVRTRRHHKGKKQKKKRGKPEPQNVFHSDTTPQVFRTNSSNARPPCVQFNTGVRGFPHQSHVRILESHDLGTMSHDYHTHGPNLTPVVENGECMCVADQSVDSAEVESSLGDDSSLEWDEELLRNPISYQDAGVLISHSKFPNMTLSSWETILQKCSGRGSWFDRFSSVCSDANLVVTNVCSACHFWAKIDDKTGNQSGIQTCLQFLSPCTSSPPSPGSVCAAFSSQQNTWKRCWYHKSVDGAAVVFYIDEGSWDQVPMETLAHLPPFVASLPMQAVPCVLSGLQLASWSPEMLPQGAKCLAELVREAQLSNKLMLSSENSPLEPIPVILVNQDTDTIINAALLTTGLATLANAGPSGAGRSERETARLAGEECTIQGGIIRGDPTPNFSSPNGSGCVQEGQSPWQLSRLNVPNESGLTAVTVSEVVSPEELWLQLSLDPKGDLERISQHISVLRPQGVGQVIQKGDICCLRLRDASGYRRVRVEVVRRQVVPNQASVLWVDTGTTHTVPTDLLCALPAELAICSVPPLAIPCRLHGIESTYGDRQNWFPLDCQLLWKHLLHKQVFANFMKRTSVQKNMTGPNQGRLGRVKLYFDPDGWESVAGTLVKEGCNVSLVDLEAPKNVATVESLGSSRVDRLQIGDPARCRSGSAVAVTGHKAFSSSPISSCKMGTVNTTHAVTVHDNSIHSNAPWMRAISEAESPAVIVRNRFEETATCTPQRSEHSPPDQDCRVTSTSAHQHVSPWKRLQQVYEQL